MFEEYLQDAYECFKSAQKAANDNDERTGRRFYRASVFYASGALEAFLNYIADSFAQAQSLSLHEIAFLNDKIIKFDADKLRVVERTEYHRLEDKLKLLIRKFMPDFDFRSASWSHINQFKNLRDSLVHPRHTEDIYSLADYDNKLRRGLVSIIQIMNDVSLGIFKRPLRRQLLDLMPD